ERRFRLLSKTMDEPSIGILSGPAFSHDQNRNPRASNFGGHRIQGPHGRPIPVDKPGYGPAMRTLNAMAAEIARTGIPVLIMGECGTGKDTYARLIHRLSQKTEAAFHKINCALESADLHNQFNQQIGEPRDEVTWGTIYLDGVQDLDLHCQRTLLSYLPDEERQGGGVSLRRRVISSTNASLEVEVEAGRFRRELYFRINGACLRL